MDRNEAKGLLPIIKAYVEGKTIQLQHIDCTWQDAKYLNLGRGLVYRIKPEPKYRPFANTEECWKEMLKHQPFIKYKVIESDKDVYLIIQRIKTDGIETDVERIDFKTAFEWFTFADGTPFGVKVEEK